MVYLIRLKTFPKKKLKESMSLCFLNIFKQCFKSPFLGVWPPYLEPWISIGGIFIKSAQQDREVKIEEKI
jgi:hypothetical protein